MEGRHRRGVTARIEVPLELLGLITGLPSGATQIPWDGPKVRIIEHQAHAHGHAALLMEERRVLVAGDMLSDVLIPMLDVSAADPIEDYLAALRLLEGVADDVDVFVPGHGSIGGADQLRARIELDRAYVQALRDGGVPDDPRIGPSARPGWEWVATCMTGKPSASPKEASATGRPAKRPTPKCLQHPGVTRFHFLGTRLGCRLEPSERHRPHLGQERP